YAALRIERVGIVAPITSTEGAVAALIAAARGESISGGTGAALAVIPVGVVLASIRGDDEDGRHSARGAVLAIVAAGIFGTGIYAFVGGRRSRIQLAGVLVIIAGVAALTAVRASS